MPVPTRILFVCLGNICRSAAAETVFAALAAQRGCSDRFVADSAGTYGGHSGQPADRRMHNHAALRGYEITHLARKIRRTDFLEFDLIVAMDDDNYDDILDLAVTPEEEKQVVRIASYLTHHDYDHIPDPYYEGAEGFELVLDLLEDACQGLLDELLASEQKNAH